VSLEFKTWRVVCTDTELPTGVTVVCEDEEHPEDEPRNVCDCCTQYVYFEAWNENAAAELCDALNARTQLHDYVEQLRDAVDQRGEASGSTVEDMVYELLEYKP
jgi:hypothetical protein